MALFSAMLAKRVAADLELERASDGTAFSYCTEVEWEQKKAIFCGLSEAVALTQARLAEARPRGGRVIEVQTPVGGGCSFPLASMSVLYSSGLVLMPVLHVCSCRSGACSFACPVSNVSALPAHVLVLPFLSPPLSTCVPLIFVPS